MRNDFCMINNVVSFVLWEYLYKVLDGMENKLNRDTVGVRNTSIKRSSKLSFMMAEEETIKLARGL